MAEQKKMSKKETEYWIRRLCEKIGLVIGAIVALYMLFTGESIEWIVGGFVGGFIAPTAIVSILMGLFESHSDPAFDAVNDRYIRETAYSKWRMDHT